MFAGEQGGPAVTLLILVSSLRAPFSTIPPPTHPPALASQCSATTGRIKASRGESAESSCPLPRGVWKPSFPKTAAARLNGREVEDGLKRGRRRDVIDNISFGAYSCATSGITPLSQARSPIVGAARVSSVVEHEMGLVAPSFAPRCTSLQLADLSPVWPGLRLSAALNQELYYNFSLKSALTFVTTIKTPFPRGLSKVKAPEVEMTTPMMLLLREIRASGRLLL